jgi:hypothetical protein
MNGRRKLIILEKCKKHKKIANTAEEIEKFTRPCRVSGKAGA